MTLRSLAMRTELLTLSGLSNLSSHDGYLIQSTPSEPDFWMGNQVIVSDPTILPAAAFKIFDAHFPDATHRAVVWDIPGLDPLTLGDVSALGCDIDGFDTMTLQGALADAPKPEGVVIRPIKSAEDWIKAEALQAEIGIEEGRDPVAHGPYLARRNAARREQIAKGLGQWFGAFDGDQIVAQMGMFHDHAVARYQSVETRATYRRRGICSALLRHAALWALARAPGAQVVIVAEADSDAGRLYRKMGYANAETIYGIVRDGY